MQKHAMNLNNMQLPNIFYNVYFKNDDSVFKAKTFSNCVEAPQHHEGWTLPTKSGTDSKY